MTDELKAAAASFDQQTEPVPPLEEQEDEFTPQLEAADPVDRDRGPVEPE